MVPRRPQPGSEEGPGLFDSAPPHRGPDEALPSSAAPWRDDAPDSSPGSAPRPPARVVKPTAQPRPPKAVATKPKSKPAAKPEAADGKPEESRSAYTVGELTRELNEMLGGLGRVAVEGEISGLKRAASGHIYLDLKDENAKLECKIWRSQVKRALQTQPAEGMRVVAHGRLDVFAPRGSYSLTIDRLEPVGQGELLVRFEQLKRELLELGWFERKRPLPALPKTIGVVTSRAGAALRDFLRTRSQRWPLYPVRLTHSVVQGVEAAAEIARAIARLDASGVDVIVVTRGGGSLEDLWAFNERPVAEAIWNASVPVVSAVGHESDTTLADLVADHRAHTPTDAAQTVIPDRAAYLERLERVGAYLTSAAEAQIERRLERLERLRSARVLRNADWILDERRSSLELVRQRLSAAVERTAVAGERRVRDAERRLVAASPKARLASWSARTEALGVRLETLTERRLVAAEGRMRELARGLEATSPLAVLARGYSVTTLAPVGKQGAGKVIKRAGDLAAGDELVTRLGEGRVRSSVLSVEAEGD